MGNFYLSEVEDFTQELTNHASIENRTFTINLNVSNLFLGHEDRESIMKRLWIKYIRKEQVLFMGIRYNIIEFRAYDGGGSVMREITLSKAD